MIISRTPFRVSFLGGGSDLPSFYKNNDYGAVISSAIKQYMYIIIHPYFQDKIRIKYSVTEDVEHIDEVRHPIVRECLRKVGIEKGIEIASFADVASGTGLGSSSSFTVGMLNALSAFKGISLSAEQLAQMACEVEIDILGEPIGKQDQFAAAYGGMNYFRFNRDESVDVVPIQLQEGVKEQLAENLRMYYVGGKRTAGSILKEQAENMSDKAHTKAGMLQMLDLAERARSIFLDSRPLSLLGELMHEGWELKQQMASGISTPHIAELYERSKNQGAVGGKLLGAGGAGFLLLFHQDHDMLSQKLSLKTLPFQVEPEGSKIIYQDDNN